ncbi:helix-turn-helix domain-containing protein [Sporosarcina sp. HYO08]|uniref:helix-turn-helix domain-containing protein n=1 Tax=Sporosarcina sp. HYO08 TaxID=1759557 RepID=UPI00155DEC20|nr:helix-turn-helix domain-containing protein [Sporosarcina sp. HYO08]
MTGLGDRLKEARTKKGYTLEDLQAITKIQKRYLSGIENEDYSTMPGSFYVRAFVKQYAEAVGLDPDEMLALYKDTAPQSIPDEEAPQPATLTRKKGLKSSNQFNEIMPKIIVALFIIVIIVVVWTLYLHKAAPSKNGVDDVKTEEPLTVENPKSDPQPPENSVAEEDADEEAKEEEEVPEVIPQTLAFESASGETSLYKLSNADAFQLEIRLTGGSWIGVRDNTGKEWMTPARVMNAGDVIEFDLSQISNARIRVGRPMSTEIYVNGEKLEYGVAPQPTVPQNIVIEYEK